MLSLNYCIVNYFSKHNRFTSTVYRR